MVALCGPTMAQQKKSASAVGTAAPVPMEPKKLSAIEIFSKGFEAFQKNDFANEIEIHYLSYLKNKCSESLRMKDDFEYKIKNNIGDKTDLINKLSNLQFNSCEEYKVLSRILKR